ncbi:16S rRNA (guanine(966)-N(2))-methyltransferase RsmD [Buchnera aphidicola]|uniref:16S rRNA (guanine(966)-N(2))-methyltransferase RsmD n=1 Tax=Buchnera aphidicola TaxID=9 RepID=UPI0034641CE7
MNKKKKFKKNTLKIIGGKLKRQKINIIHSKNLRPTKNFIRETLFNWLNKYIQNSICLDCFAGSGILGIESISRYAKLVTSLEINKKIFFKMYKNLKKLNIHEINIININALQWLKKKENTYDIIFLDPPYNCLQLLQKTIFLLEKNKYTKKNTIIYIEKKISKQKIEIPKTWILKKSKKQKKIEYKIYLKK